MRKIAINLNIANYLSENMNLFIKGLGGEEIWKFLCKNGPYFISSIKELKDSKSNPRQTIDKKLIEIFGSKYNTEKINQIKTIWLNAVIGKMSSAFYKEKILRRAGLLRN